MRVLFEQIIIVLLSTFLWNINKITYELIIALLICLSLALFLTVIHQERARQLTVLLMVLVHLFLPSSHLYIALSIYTIILVYGTIGMFANLFVILIPTPVAFICVLLANHLAWYYRKEQDFRSFALSNQDTLRHDNLTLRRQQKQLEQRKLKDIEIATLEERNRIAHQLHDSIGHVISSSILQLEAMQITTNDEKTKRQLEVVSGVLQNGMTDIRENLHNLYEGSFHLKYKIEEILQLLTKQNAKLHYSVDSQLSLEFKVDMISMVKEFVTNCQKHSNADQVQLYIIEQPHFIMIHYLDNGTAIQSDHLAGIGMLAMEDTVKKYCGTMTVHTHSGFEVHLTLKKDSSRKELADERFNRRR